MTKPNPLGRPDCWRKSPEFLLLLQSAYHLIASRLTRSDAILRYSQYREIGNRPASQNPVLPPGYRGLQELQQRSRNLIRTMSGKIVPRTRHNAGCHEVREFRFIFPRVWSGSSETAILSA